jgi:predicted GTPase
MSASPPFNRILGRRKSSSTRPGADRDSVTAECVLGDRRFTLVDTAACSASPTSR